jgi:peptide/nickel transport system substrate-binding protein
MNNWPVARRNFLAVAGAGAGAAAAALSLPSTPRAQGTPGPQPRRGGTLTAIVQPEPPTLVSALNAGAPVGVVSTNIFDGLFTYNWDMSFKPSLAETWDVSEDGLTITFNLRRGVTWHDGKPFTSADVAFSLEEIWRKIHPRGRSTFINVRKWTVPTRMWWSCIFPRLRR